MSRRARHPPREFLWAANLWTQSSWTVREVRKAAWGFHLNGEKNVPHSFLFPMEILQCSFPSSFSQLVDYPINGGQLSSTALWELWWLRTISIEAGTLLSSPECFSRSHWLFCSFSNCSSLAEQEKPEAQVRVNLYRFTRVFLPLNPHILQVWQPLMGRWFTPFPFPTCRFYPRG